VNPMLSGILISDRIWWAAAKQRKHWSISDRL